MREGADIRGRAADIDDDRVLQPGQKCRAAHRIGRAGGKGQHRKGTHDIGCHERAVVLRDIEWAWDTGCRKRLAEGSDGAIRERQQARIHDGRTFASQEAMTADILRHDDRQAGAMLLQDFLGPQLHGIVDAAENAGHGRGLQPFRPDFTGDAYDGILIERRKLASVKFVATLDLVTVISDDLAQLIWPIDHRRQAGARRQAQADGCDLVHMPALDDSIGEMRGADHDGRNTGPVDAGGLDDLLQCFDHARSHILGGRGLDPGQNGLSLQDDSIRIGAADVNSNAIHVRLLFDQSVVLTRKRVRSSSLTAGFRRSSSSVTTGIAAISARV